MFKPQLKFQKILSFILLAAFAVLFVYSLSMMTDLSVLAGAYNPELKVPDWVTSEILASYTRQELADMQFVQYVDGAKLYYDMQPFNNQAILCSFLVLFGVLSFLVTGCASRRKYYIGNFISTALISVINIGVTIFMCVKLTGFRTEFLRVLTDEADNIKYYCEKPPKKELTDSTFWFDAGYVVSALLIVVMALVIANLIWKIILMKKEEALLDGTTKEVV